MNTQFLRRLDFRRSVDWGMMCALIPILLPWTVGAKTTSSTNNGAWFQPANPPLTWNNGIPGPSDVVNIGNTVNLNTNAGTVVNVGLLNISNAGTNAGFLGCSGPLLYLNGAGSTWSAGAYYSSYVIVNGSLILNAAGGSTNPIQTGVITNFGTITHQGVASLELLNCSWLRNTASALYDFKNDVGITNYATLVCSPPPFFENEGVLRKSGGSDESRLDLSSFYNLGGTIDVQVGEITLAINTAICTNGTFNASNGAVFNLTHPAGNGGSYTFSGAFTGAGAGQVQLNLDNIGTLSAYSPCSFNFPTNFFQWNSGNLGGGNTLTNVGSISLASTNYKSLSQTLVNWGQVEERSTGIFHLFRSFLNLSGGLFEFQSDAGISDSIGNGILVNSGVLRKTSGSGTSVVAVAFSNLGGTIDVQSGQITLAQGGGSTNGTFNVAAGAVLDLTGGFVGTGYYGTYTGSGAGQVQLNSGAIEIFSPNSCTFNFPSNLFQWNGGQIYVSAGALTNLGSLTLAGTANKLLNGMLANFGQVEQTGTGIFYCGMFQNMSGGFFEFQSDAGIGAGNSFTNFGLFCKTGGSGTSSVGVPFLNSGTVEVRSGTLSFAGSFPPFTQTAGITSLNGGSLAVASGNTLNFQGGSLIGSGQITGNVSNSGVVSPGFSVGTIQINGNFTQAGGAAFNVELAGRNSGQFDQINVTGSATLNGALNVTPLPGFAPAAGDAYQILSYASHSGTFSATNGLPVGMVVDYRTNGVFLDVTTNIAPTIIQPTLAGTNFTFFFQSVAGVNYTVQVNTNLATTNWLTLQVIPGDGSAKSVTNPAAAASQKYFRLLR